MKTRAGKILCSALLVSLSFGFTVPVKAARVEDKKGTEIQDRFKELVGKMNGVAVTLASKEPEKAKTLADGIKLIQEKGLDMQISDAIALVRALDSEGIERQDILIAQKEIVKILEELLQLLQSTKAEEDLGKKLDLLKEIISMTTALIKVEETNRNLVSNIQNTEDEIKNIIKEINELKEALNRQNQDEEGRAKNPEEWNKANDALSGKIEKLSEKLGEFSKTQANNNTRSGKAAGKAADKASKSTADAGKAASNAAKSNGSGDGNAGGEAKKNNEEAKKKLEDAKKEMEDALKDILENLKKKDLEETAKVEAENIMKTDDLIKKINMAKSGAGDAAEGAKKSQSGAKGDMDFPDKAVAALEKQSDAIRKLKEVRDIVEKEKRETEDEIQERALFQVEQKLTEMVKRQKLINVETLTQFEKITGNTLSTQQVEAVVRLRGDEAKNMTDTDDIISLLEEDGSSLVFMGMFKDLRKDVDELVNRLLMGEEHSDIASVDAYTQKLEAEALDTMEMLLSAIIEERNRRMVVKISPPSPSQPGKPGPSKKTPLIPPVAELIMIKFKQQKVQKAWTELSFGIEGEKELNRFQRLIRDRLTNKQTLTKEMFEKIVAGTAEEESDQENND